VSLTALRLNAGCYPLERDAVNGRRMRGARDNAEMESFNRRFKTEHRELFAEGGQPRGPVAGRRVHHYNSKRRHFSIGNMTLAAYVR